MFSHNQIKLSGFLCGQDNIYELITVFKPVGFRPIVGIERRDS